MPDCCFCLRSRGWFVRSPSRERLNIETPPSEETPTTTKDAEASTSGTVAVPTASTPFAAFKTKWAMLQAFIANFFSQRFANSFKRDGGTCGCDDSKEPETGAESRYDEKVKFGFSLLRGKRSTMEDFLDARFKRHKNGDIIGFFGVYDGHGGPGCARYVRDNLLNNLLENPKFVSDLRGAVERSYLVTDKKYLSTSLSYKDDGCTAVSAVIVDRKLVVANIGDSRAVLCHDGKAVQLSVDHKPNLFAEKERIENQGGLVAWAGTWRVGGILAVSRAFGDRPLKKYVIAQPHTTVIEELTLEHEYLILATDGVWDVLTNDEAVEIVGRQKDAQKAASLLTSIASTRGSTDNISCIVIRFDFS